MILVVCLQPRHEIAPMRCAGQRCSAAVLEFQAFALINEPAMPIPSDLIVTLAVLDEDPETVRVLDWERL